MDKANGSVRARDGAPADLLILSETPMSTVYQVFPHSDVGRDWCLEHLPDEARMGQVSYVVEHRFINNIAEGAANDGLTVVWGLKPC